MSERLSLYYTPSCPYCVRVLQALPSLRTEVARKNLWTDAENRTDLRNATGRGTVPVLRIQNDEGLDRWMPESLDILEYLRERHS